MLPLVAETPDQEARTVLQKRDPVKQIMSDVHKEARAGKLDLSGHEGFIAEVQRRVRAAGLPDEALRQLTARGTHDGVAGDGSRSGSESTD